MDRYELKIFLKKKRDDRIQYERYILLRVLISTKISLKKVEETSYCK